MEKLCGQEVLLLLLVKLFTNSMKIWENGPGQCFVVGITVHSIAHDTHL